MAEHKTRLFIRYTELTSKSSTVSAMRSYPLRLKRPSGFWLVIVAITPSSAMSVVTVAPKLLFSGIKINRSVTEQRSVSFRENQNYNVFMNGPGWHWKTWMLENMKQKIAQFCDLQDDSKKMTTSKVTNKIPNVGFIQTSKLFFFFFLNSSISKSS